MFALIVLGISHNQVPFKEGHRTSNHVFVLNSIIKQTVQVERKKLFVVFIDFRKDYDEINRNLIILKLQRLAVKGQLYKDIKAIYDNISYMIEVCGLLGPNFLHMRS